MKTTHTSLALLLATVGAASVTALEPNDPGRNPVPANRRFPTGSVVFFHPDGTGANHWSAARMYFKGPDG
jgi:alkaline phosphatase